MPPEDFSETSQALCFDDTTKDSDPLFLPDEEMYEDENDINAMLVPSDPLYFAVDPDGGNQDMVDWPQPNPPPTENTEFGNDAERPMRVRVQNTPISHLIDYRVCRICQHELVCLDKLKEIFSVFRSIQTRGRPHLDLSIIWV